MGWVDERPGGNRRKLTSTITALLLVVRLIALTVGVGVAVGRAEPALAVDLPPVASPLFLQTGGPNAGIGIGDWYSSPPPGGGTDHLFELNVPQLWPAGTPLTVALFDPEVQIPDPVSPTAIDEIRGSGPDDATFTLLSPVGTVLASVTYTPNGGTNGQWTELLTFDPDVHGTGTYLLRATVANNDDNSWRLAFNNDPDCNVTGTPQTCAPALLSNGNQVDNPDGSPGTGDELTIGIQRASYQHGGVGQTCKTFYFFVAPGTTSISLHNFDMDSNGSVNYHSPSGSSYVGTVSANARWNNSLNATRVGDLIALGAADEGWWSADLCISSGNQYIFEGVNGESVFLDLIPAVPRMTLSKSDGVGAVDPGETITYILTYTNTSDSTSNPGLATNVNISDTIPSATSYQSCSIDSPASGTCSESGGVVTFSLDNPVLPGMSGTVRVTAGVNGGASGSIANSATLTYSDPLGNNYSPQLATDVDTVRSPQLAVNKSASAGPVEPGDVITYTVDLVNTGGGTQTGVLATDDLPPGTSVVPGSTVISQTAVAGDDFQSNNYAGGSGWTGPWVEFVDDGVATTGDIRIGTDLDASLRLGVGGRDGGPNQPRWIERPFDANGATSATLSFNYRSVNLEVGDFVYVQIYDGATYHQVAALGNGVNYGTTQTFGPFDISSFVSATSAIRMITTTLSADDNRVWFDNVAISLTTTTAGGDPPTLLDGYSLAVGESLTVTYDVLVDNPAAISAATNTVIARSDQSTPVSDSTTTGVTSASIGDLVWNDLDADGVLDGGEPGLVGITVDLTWAGSNGSFGDADDVLYASQVTDGSGMYDFTGLPSGLFRVDVDDATLPLGATLTTAAEPLDVAVVPGEDFNGADFGYRIPAVGDVVWVDVDGDGIQDVGEPGLAGVTVSLFTDADVQVGLSQVTAAD
ncbi:MAG: SdrD B-like domain-containing protein, partial [Acidimicrobiia bacterium]